MTVVPLLFLLGGVTPVVIPRTKSTSLLLTLGPLVLNSLLKFWFTLLRMVLPLPPYLPLQGGPASRQPKVWLLNPLLLRALLSTTFVERLATRLSMLFELLVTPCSTSVVPFTV